MCVCVCVCACVAHSEWQKHYNICHVKIFAWLEVVRYKWDAQRHLLHHN